MLMNYPSGVALGKLKAIKIPSIYSNYSIDLPTRLAWVTPDAAEAVYKLIDTIEENGGKLYTSDAYRSTEIQAQARYDYLLGTGQNNAAEDLEAKYPFLENYKARPKRAYSGPPGTSMHEAGRAFDFDLDPFRLKMDQSSFAILAYEIGFVNIVGGVQGMGNPLRVDVSEEWHWEFRGPFQDTYDAVLAESKNSKLAYLSMVKAAISDIAKPGTVKVEPISDEDWQEIPFVG